MVLKRCVRRVLARAQQAEQDGNLADALRLAEAILEDHPLHAEARLVRARVWTRTGRIDGAMAELRALISRNADFMEARLALTGVLLLTGKYSDAVDHLIVVAKQCGEELGTEGTVTTSLPSLNWSVGLANPHRIPNTQYLTPETPETRLRRRN